ncbi:MAG: long-chain fatty acid--CoA ligase [Candidatus Bathyarchaeota archaeon]|nr:long-chain fatty acid--CoA ligase [Candidatus Bathyarchaeota archaeon]
MSLQDKPWLVAYPPEIPKTLNYPKIPLHSLLENAAKKHPNHAAITFQGNQTTYIQLNEQANRFANALVQIGIKKGDRVAIFLPNIPQFVIAYFGVLKAGAAVTTISPLHREREVAFQLSDSGAKAVVMLDSLFPIVEVVQGKSPLKHIILTGLNSFSPEASVAVNTVSFQTILENSSPQPINIQINPETDLAALQYTGGTTGTPKAAMLTHQNLLSNALAFAAWIKGTPKDVFLAALPLFHIYGMTTSMTVPVSLGAELVLMPRFEPIKALEIIQKEKVTVFCGVPTMYQTLLANPELDNHDITSIRVCISGASSLPPEVQRRFMQVTGGFLAEGYGLSEASPVTHCTPVDPTMKTVKVGSIGLPLPDTQARIVDLETGTKPLAAGEIGELAVKGPQVMLGYWEKPEETKLVLRNGWLLTGDVARMDSEGYFFIVERKKDLIKYRDFSVYPRELEDLLYEHPTVRMCAVVGKPDAYGGEIPKAYVVLKDDAVVSNEELMEFVNGKVASYKAIRELELKKELPLSAAGKVLKRVLKEHA